MKLKRAWHFLGAVSAAGALLFTTAPVAHADAARNKQWALQVFKAQDRVWPLSTGKGVTVAVIDTGVRATHTDLTGQVLPGRNFVTGGTGQTDTAANGHGTGIASLIAGHGHGPGQSEGIKGLAPDAKILPLVYATGSAQGDSQIAQAIHYAVDHGAGVINMSFGGIGSGTVLQSAIAYAEAHNVVLVAAAGNEGTQEDDYPASFPGVISVGAADQSGAIWGGSNYGPHLVLVAPGTGILGDSSGTDTQYALGDGTSYATAYVSAAAALVRSKFPQLTAGQVINRLIKTATDPNAKAGQTTPDPHYGYGILRPDAALNTTLAAGPAAGPLQQATDPLASGSGGDKNTSSAAAGPATKPSSTASSSSTGLVVGIAVAVLLLLLAFVVTLVVLSRRRRRRSAAASPVPGTQPPPPAGQSVYQGGWANPGQQPQYQQPQYPPQYPQQAPPQYPPQAPPPPADGGGNPPDPRSYR